MHPALEEFKIMAEKVLQPILADAQAFYGNDDGAYFVWLQKASLLKLGKPEMPFDLLTPQAMSRPNVEVFRKATQKRPF